MQAHSSLFENSGLLYGNGVNLKDETENLTLRIPAELKRAIEGLADDEDRSQNSMVTILLSEAIAARQQKGEGEPSHKSKKK